jgi:hypothetical protein
VVEPRHYSSIRLVSGTLFCACGTAEIGFLGAVPLWSDLTFEGQTLTPVCQCLIPRSCAG